MNRENVMAVLFDITMVIGSEVRLKPLLTKTLQRLLYHTSFPAGLVFLQLPPATGAQSVNVRLDAAVGDYHLGEKIDQTLQLPAGLLYGGAELNPDAKQLMNGLRRLDTPYRSFLRLPIDNNGVILLLSPQLPLSELPLVYIFQPVLANLSRAIVLCRDHEALTAGLVAERDSARAALEESEAKFRGINTAAQDAIVMIDDNGRLAYWNPAAERMFGYPADEVLGQDAHRLIAPSRYHALFQQGFAKFRRHGNGAVVGKTLEIEALRKGDTEFPVELSISALQLNHRWHAVGIIRDISQRKKDEAALQHSENSLKEAQRIAHLGNWDLDLVNDRLSWSEEIYHIFEIGPGDLGGSYAAYLELVHPEDRSMVSDALQSAIGKHDTFDIVYRLLTTDGRLKYVNERGETLYAPDGTPLRAVGTIQDVTERTVADVALRKAYRALKTLSSCNAILVRTTDETALLRDICHLIVEVGEYRMAWVGYAEQDEAKTVRVMAAAGYDEGFTTSWQWTWADSNSGRGPTGRAIRLGSTQYSQNIVDDLSYGPWQADALRRGYVSSIALPLIDEGSVFGVLHIYSGEPAAFNEEEVGLLQELADDLAFGIRTLRIRQERGRLEEAQHVAAERLQKALLGTIQAVALTVEKRDPYTAGHQQNVARLAQEIATELGWPKERIEGLRLGAFIHDIGKIYVPAEILSRPGALADAEFMIIKSHPDVGYSIMKDVELPWPVAEMIHQHHERLDGSGYPRGLTGDAIIPEARLLAVADVVEAMASHRPYRPAKGLAAAIEEIQQHRGTRFDSEVVDACVRVLARSDVAQSFEHAPVGHAQ